MKYLLVIGIDYKFYKKPADVTIHIGGKFVDTFQLENTLPSTPEKEIQIETQWLQEHNFLFRQSSKRKFAEVPALFKIYEIEDSAIEGNLEIKVNNSNTDFTNGFMNNNSVIKFPIIALFKKDLVYNRGEKLVKLLVKLDNACSKIQKKNVNRHPWPRARYFHILRENKIYEESGIRYRKMWLGGSFLATFKIETKHSMKYLAPMDGSKFLGFPAPIQPESVIISCCTKLLNIYNEN